MSNQQYANYGQPRVPQDNYPQAIQQGYPGHIASPQPQPGYPGYTGAPQPIYPGQFGIGVAPQPTHLDNLNYHLRAARILGFIQIIIGIICFVLNCILIGMSIPGFNLQYTGYGIWGGTTFLIAGILQVSSGKNYAKKGLIVATMVMSIIANIISFVIFIMAIINLSILDVNKERTYNFSVSYGGTFRYNNFERDKISDNELERADGMLITTIVISVVEFIISLITSILCCRAVCCRSNRQMTMMPVYVVENQQGHYYASNPAFTTVTHPPVASMHGQYPAPTINNHQEYPTPHYNDNFHGVVSSAPPAYDAPWNPDDKV